MRKREFAVLKTPLSLRFGACAAEGTDYCDLTGEAAWVERMAFEHHSAAVASGATLVPAAGLETASHPRNIPQ